jgi:hypothetical protein
MRAAIKEWSLRLGLMMGSLLVSLLIIEVILRVFFPLYGGRDNVTLDGRSITSFLQPGTVYRQLSNEYDALTTITDKGHRVPAVDGNPEIVFVGDSFTFGFGLTDDETFASIYCKHQQRSCANLGMPGSGTSRQVKRLEQFIERWNWRPKQVKLFFFGMSRSFSSGNDFVDNYNYGQWFDAQSKQPVASASLDGRKAEPAPAPRDKPQVGFGEWILSWQTFLLENVHLVRHAKYHWGPMLRTFVLAEPDEKRRAAALHYSERGFRELDALSRRVGFAYEVYLIVPSHDILMGTDGETLAMLSSVASSPPIATAQLFREAPGDFYFSYDGHLNPKGSRRLAEFLVAREAAQSRK